MISTCPLKNGGGIRANVGDYANSMAQSANPNRMTDLAPPAERTEAVVDGYDPRNRLVFISELRLIRQLTSLTTLINLVRVETTGVAEVYVSLMAATRTVCLG